MGTLALSGASAAVLAFVIILLLLVLAVVVIVRLALRSTRRSEQLHAEASAHHADHADRRGA